MPSMAPAATGGSVSSGREEKTDENSELAPFADKMDERCCRKPRVTPRNGEENRKGLSVWIGAEMGEKGGANIEVAHHLNEGEEHAEKHGTSPVHIIVEVIEAILLALVAITTAWSGYQSARFDSVQSELYGRSSRLRVEGQALELESNQAKQYDASTIVEWLKAEATGQTKLAALFERRLLPEIRPAFEAW